MGPALPDTPREALAKGLRKIESRFKNPYTLNPKPQTLNPKP